MKCHQHIIRSLAVTSIAHYDDSRGNTLIPTPVVEGLKHSLALAGKFVSDSGSGKSSSQADDEKSSRTSIMMAQASPPD